MKAHSVMLSGKYEFLMGCHEDKVFMFSKDCIFHGGVSGGGGNVLGVREFFFNLKQYFPSWCVSVYRE